MDLKSIRELEILQEFSENEQINHRYLSKKLTISTGLVHLYIKRLVQKGYIKITGIKPRRLKYLLTPQGIAAKTKLTYEFTLSSYKYFKAASGDIRKKLAEAASKPSPFEVAAVGTDVVDQLREERGGTMMGIELDGPKVFLVGSENGLRRLAERGPAPRAEDKPAER